VRQLLSDKPGAASRISARETPIVLRMSARVRAPRGKGHHGLARIYALFHELTPSVVAGVCGALLPFPNCHRKWQRKRTRFGGESERRVGVTPLTRRCRANTRTCERPGQTKKDCRGRSMTARRRFAIRKDGYAAIEAPIGLRASGQPSSASFCLCCGECGCCIDRQGRKARLRRTWPG
jgi:hypothetical protein